MRSNTSTTPLDDVIVSFSCRVKVHIHCRHCGETYILRGARDSKGRVETGFKRCLCDNEYDFDVEPLA